MPKQKNTLLSTIQYNEKKNLCFFVKRILLIPVIPIPSILIFPIFQAL